MLGSRAGPSPRPPTRERPPNFGAKIDIYIYIYIQSFHLKQSKLLIG